MATIRKSTAARSSATASAETPEAPAEAPAGGGAPAPAPLEKGALIDEVVRASGVRKRDAKPVIEATLAAIGRALDEGRQVKLSPLGQMRVVKSNAGGSSVTHTMKLRRKPAAGEGAAEVAEGEGAG